ncbi:flagellar hook assembly protein FlgD [Allosphingosinicella vermicomposti]|uniref:flagellar hook assembly protein FlgD n=1 Tax=Allosphingosinicella vermicomposti TaxID=614671 RepID=UPI000D0FDDB2|nr:flagellar hook capping FlgD N-terminal domain-containing protein [Allosphingosinicella vermicomposti]
MTTITGNNAAQAQTNTTAAASSGGLDQNAFLKLMTTQLTMQDPFNPMDNTQMVAQMAQFSQVSGIAEMNRSLKSLTEMMGAGRLNDAAAWLNRSMLVLSDYAAPMTDGSYSGEVHLADDAKDVTLSLVDSSGAVVHSEQMGSKPKGPFTFAWDGKNAAGEAVPGPLKVVVTASTADGKSIETATATWTQVQSIQSPASGVTQLMTGLGTLSPQDAIRLA